MRDMVCEKIEEKEIWIPYGEFKHYFGKKLDQYNRKNLIIQNITKEKMEV
jgi:hypothetical protein